MDYVIRGVPVEQYEHLFGLSDDALEKEDAKRYQCDEENCYPDRIEMRDAKVGESLLLVNHTSMALPTPYRATHAIFVLEGAKASYEAKNEIPAVMYRRLLSLRAFDEDGMMIGAAIAEGETLEPAILQLFEDEAVDHIDAHNAVRGCFSGKITRG